MLIALVTINGYSSNNADNKNSIKEKTMNKSICIVESGTGSSKELLDLCKEIMPDVKVYQIIDDSLLPEMISNSGLTKDVNRRFMNCYLQAESLGVDAIFHQCVVGGDIPNMVEPFIGTPIIRIDEGMMHKALETGNKIAVFAFVKAALNCSCSLLQLIAEKECKSIHIDRHLLDKSSDIREEVIKAAKDNDVIILAQPSMTVQLPKLQNVGKPVLTAPKTGIEYLYKRVMEPNKINK
jgi:hypothetical protein